MALHSCLLLRAGTGTTVLRAGLVELPGKVEREGATGRIVRCQLPVSVDDSIRLVSMEGIAATEVEGQRAHALQADVALQSDVGEETRLGHAEIVVVTFRIPLGRDIEAETMRQFYVILPADNEPRVVERAPKLWFSFTM